MPCHSVLNEVSALWIHASTLLSCFSYKTLPIFLCRCREKQRKEASRLQTVNRKLTAMNKLLMEENDRLQKQVSHLVYENGFMKQQIQTVIPYSLMLWFGFSFSVILMLTDIWCIIMFCHLNVLFQVKDLMLWCFPEQASATTTTDNSCESVVMSGQNQQQNPTPQHPQRDANNPAG